MDGELEKPPPKATGSMVVPASAASHTCPFSFLLKTSVQKAFIDLRNLADNLPMASDTERKRSLVEYANRTRATMIRLLVLLKWSRVNLHKVYSCWNVLEVLERQDSSCRDAADMLYTTHDMLKLARAPAYDIATAIDVLTTGTYPRMPAVVKKIATPKKLNPDETQRTVKRLNETIRSHLLTTTIPMDFTNISVNNGAITVTYKGLYEACLTLDIRDLTDSWSWRLISLDFFVSDTSSANPIPATNPIRSLVERRVRSADQPLVELAMILGRLCTSMMFDMLQAQAMILQSSLRWTGVIKVDIIKEELVSLSLVCKYWSSSPRLKLEAKPVVKSEPSTPSTAPSTETPSPAATNPTASSAPNPEEVWLQVKMADSSSRLVVVHNPPFPPDLDPSLTPLAVSPTLVSFERLLSSAIERHTKLRLSQLYAVVLKALKANSSELKGVEARLVMPSRSESADGTWQQSSMSNGLGASALHIGLFGEDDPVAVVVDMRTGRFVLSRHTTAYLDTAAVFSCEEKLNRNLDEISTVLVALRLECILERLESAGRSLRLEPFRQIPLLQPPPTSLSNPIFFRISSSAYSYGCPLGYLVADVTSDFTLKFSSLLLRSTDDQSPPSLTIEAHSPITDDAAQHSPKPPSRAKRKRQELTTGHNTGPPSSSSSLLLSSIIPSLSRVLPIALVRLSLSEASAHLSALGATLSPIEIQSVPGRSSGSTSANQDVTSSAAVVLAVSGRCRATLPTASDRDRDQFQFLSNEIEVLSSVPIPHTTAISSSSHDTAAIEVHLSDPQRLFDPTPIHLLSVVPAAISDPSAPLSCICPSPGLLTFTYSTPQLFRKRLQADLQSLQFLSRIVAQLRRGRITPLNDLITAPPVELLSLSPSLVSLSITGECTIQITPCISPAQQPLISPSSNPPSSSTTSQPSSDSSSGPSSSSHPIILQVTFSPSLSPMTPHLATLLHVRRDIWDLVDSVCRCYRPIAAIQAFLANPIGVITNPPPNQPRPLDGAGGELAVVCHRFGTVRLVFQGEKALDVTFGRRGWVRLNDALKGDFLKRFNLGNLMQNMQQRGLLGWSGVVPQEKNVLHDELLGKILNAWYKYVAGMTRTPPPPQALPPAAPAPSNTTSQTAAGVMLAVGQTPPRR